jgi:hypothetical protein
MLRDLSIMRFLPAHRDSATFLCSWSSSALFAAEAENLPIRLIVIHIVDSDDLDRPSSASLSVTRISFLLNRQCTHPCG